MESYSLVSSSCDQLGIMSGTYTASPHIFLASPVFTFINTILIQLTKHFAKSLANVWVWNCTNVAFWVPDELWRVGEINTIYSCTVTARMTIATAVIHAFPAFCTVHLSIGGTSRPGRGSTYSHTFWVVEHGTIPAVGTMSIYYRDAGCLASFCGSTVSRHIFTAYRLCRFNFC